MIDRCDSHTMPYMLLPPVRPQSSGGRVSVPSLVHSKVNCASSSAIASLLCIDSSLIGRHSSRSSGSGSKVTSAQSGLG